MPKREKRACRVCGCTDARACDGGCWWVERDLCSTCIDDAKPPEHFERAASDAFLVGVMRDIALARRAGNAPPAWAMEYVYLAAANLSRLALPPGIEDPTALPDPDPQQVMNALRLDAHSRRHIQRLRAKAGRPA